jgi:hypothetical protein
MAAGGCAGGNHRDLTNNERNDDMDETQPAAPDPTAMPATTNVVTIEDIARVCHQANRAYCESLGDHTQQTWEGAFDWQRQSAINGVRFRLENPGAPASASHENWLAEKRADGWTYGPVKDVEKKQHPCFMPYDGLPIEQRRKDALFIAVVDALRV